METLSVSKAEAIKAYNAAGADGKAIMTKLFGAEALSQKITDRVKTFEDACELLGIVHFQGTHTPKDVAAYTKLVIIARALNEGWTPDWNDSNQYKYYPFFDMRSGFSFYDCGCNDRNSRLGSRLCFRSSQLAEYAARQFESIYNDFFKL